MNDGPLPNKIRDFRNAADMSAEALGRLVGLSGPTITRLETGERRLKHDQAVKIAAALRRQVGELIGEPAPIPAQALAEEAVAEVATNVRPAPEARAIPTRQEMPRDVPVLGTAAGARDEGAFILNQGEPIDYVRRGPGIMNSTQVFSLYVEGESMEPRYEQGDQIYLDPARPVRIGDYVLVVMKMERLGVEPQAFLKRLVRRGPEATVLAQFNPQKELTIPTRQIEKLVKVLRWEEVMGI